MASKSFSGDSRYTLHQRATLISQSTSTNTSRVRIEAWITSGGSKKFNLNTDSNVKVVANGSTLIDKNISYDFRNYSRLNIINTIITVTHKDDGSKSFNLTSSANLLNPQGLGSAGVSETVGLNTIARKTKPSVPGSFDLDNPLPVTLPRAASSFTHKVVMRIRTPNDGIKHLLGITDVGTSTNITLTDAQKNTIMDWFPNTTNCTLDIVVTTYSGSTDIGYEVVSVIGRVPARVKPSFTGIDAYHLTVGGDEKPLDFIPIANHTPVLYKAKGAVPGRGSRISRTVLSIQDSSPSGKYYLFNSYGDKDIRVTIYDSRGRTAVRTMKQRVNTVYPIKIERMDVIRTNRDGSPNPNGKYAKIVGKISNTGPYESDLAGMLAISAYVREKGTSKWHNIYTGEPKEFIESETAIRDDIISDTDFQNPASSSITPIPLYNNRLAEVAINKSYEFDVRIGYTSLYLAELDSLEGRYYTILPTIEVIMDVGQDGVGFGKVHERGSVDAIGQIYQNNGNKVANGHMGTLPAGNCKTQQYWHNIEDGIYQRTSANAISGAPSQWAIVLVMKTNAQEFSVLWQSQASGPMWRGSGNANSFSGWHEIAWKSDIANLPTTHANISMSSGYTLDDGKVSKQGNVVSVRGIVRGTIPDGAYTKVGTLPAGYRPPVRIIAGTAMTAGRPGAVELWPNGDIKMGNYTGYNNGWGSLSTTFII